MAARHLIRLVALIAALAGAAGCGGGGTNGPERQAFTGSQVVREFQQTTGRALTEAAGQDPAWDQLGYGLDPPPSLLRRYGIFTVYVVEAGNEEALASLLSDKATGKPLEPDARSVLWERDSQSGTWIAYKQYGENVVLAWFSETKARGTDDRFARLDRILSGLS